MEKHGVAINVIKRGELLKGIIYKDMSDGSFPYYGEVHRGDAVVYKSAKYIDEDYVEQWIDQKFNLLIGGK